MRLFGNCARSLRWKSESGIGRTMATASTSSGLRAGQFEAGGDRLRRQLAAAAEAHAAGASSFDSSTAATSSPSFNMRGGRVAEDAADSENDHVRLLCLCSLLDFGPGVAQRHGAVEDRLAGRGIGIDAEVAEPLELVARARRRRSPATAPAWRRSGLRASSDSGSR